MAIQAHVELSGLFFKNPVGQLHVNIYDVLQDTAEAGAAATAAFLTPGHGLLSGALRDSIEPRLDRASRRGYFTGKARVIAGALGSWAPTPSAGTRAPWIYAEARNRAVAKKVNAKQRFMYRGAALTQAWINGNLGRIETVLSRKLS